MTGPESRKTDKKILDPDTALFVRIAETSDAMMKGKISVPKVSDPLARTTVPVVPVPRAAAVTAFDPYEPIENIVSDFKADETRGSYREVRKDLRKIFAAQNIRYVGQLSALMSPMVFENQHPISDFTKRELQRLLAMRGSRFGADGDKREALQAVSVAGRRNGKNIPYIFPADEQEALVAMEKAYGPRPGLQTQILPVVADMVIEVVPEPVVPGGFVVIRLSGEFKKAHGIKNARQVEAALNSHLQETLDVYFNTVTEAGLKVVRTSSQNPATDFRIEITAAGKASEKGVFAPAALRQFIAARLEGSGEFRQALTELGIG